MRAVVAHRIANQEMAKAINASTTKRTLFQFENSANMTKVCLAYTLRQVVYGLLVTDEGSIRLLQNGTERA
jgi:hypothetical protein